MNITLATIFNLDGERTTLVEIVRHLRSHGMASDLHPDQASEIPDLMDDFVHATTTTGVPTVHQVLAAYYLAATTKLSVEYLSGAITREQFENGQAFINATVFDLT